MIPASPTKSPPQSVFWGEEREDGAVYAVTLKKVRYRSSDLKLFTDDEEISHLQWKTLKIRKIKNGTLPKLVEHLAPCKATLDEIDPGYLVAFLTTYRSFAKPQDVLNLLLERYRAFNQDGANKAEVVERVHRGVLAVLSVWLEQFPYDFSDPPNYPDLTKMLHFVEREVTESGKSELEKKIKSRIERFKITPFDDQGDPIQFRLSMTNEVDYVVVQKEASSSAVLETRKMVFQDVSAEKFAEQLTLMDAELFKKVVAWHCLGYMWSRRGKNKGDHAPTVKATVDQFNAVSLRVISTILCKTMRKNGGAGLRAQAISHWINVAQECRDMKNFSSLKAIVAGLQSSAIHRLKKSWSHVSREKNALFDELSGICSEERNQEQSRELLMKEGTAKHVEDLFPRTKSGSIKKRKSRFLDLSVMQGTVPYLGTFLTDLMMLDAAYSDCTADGFINFDKRRKEFEVIAQIKLLQESAKNYTIEPDDKFRQWFDSLETFSEDDSYRISCERETEIAKKSCSEKKRRSLLNIGTLRKMLSEPDISKLMLSPDTIANVKATSKSTETSPATPRRHQRQGSESSTSSGVSTGSEGSSNRTDSQTSSPVPILLSRTPSMHEAHEHPIRKKSGDRERFAHSLSLPRTGSPPTIVCVTPPATEGYIVRVSLDTNEDNGLLYKGIWLANDEHTTTVIRACLAKHDLEDDPQDYKLVQILPSGGKIEIPGNANVYYALNSSAYPLTLQLVKKT